MVETEITERLEETINNIEGIKTLRSESREGVSSITIEFDLSRDIDIAAQDVRDRVSRVRGNLPEDIREPIIAKQDSDAQPIIWITLNSDRYSPLELTTMAERQIKPRFQSVPGVSSVIIGGEKRFAMRLWLDSEKMAARQVTVLDVQRALHEQNIELPSGRVENLDREMTIQTRGELKTSEEFNNLVIRTEGSTLVRLRDIGRAEEGVEDTARDRPGARQTMRVPRRREASEGQYGRRGQRRSRRKWTPSKSHFLRAATCGRVTTRASTSKRPSSKCGKPWASRFCWWC